MNRSARGSALLVAVIALLVMSVIGVAILRYGYREVAGASAGSREQAMVACARAARQLLASRFHALGTDPVALVPLDVRLGAHMTARGGHYGDTTNVQVEQVVPLQPEANGPVAAAKDITNIITTTVVGKAPYKVMVRCVADNGTELEMEYGVRFGL